MKPLITEELPVNEETEEPLKKAHPIKNKVKTHKEIVTASKPETPTKPESPPIQVEKEGKPKTPPKKPLMPANIMAEIDAVAKETGTEAKPVPTQDVLLIQSCDACGNVTPLASCPKMKTEFGVIAFCPHCGKVMYQQKPELPEVKELKAKVLELEEQLNEAVDLAVSFRREIPMLVSNTGTVLKAIVDNEPGELIKGLRALLQTLEKQFDDKDRSDSSTQV